MDPVLGEEGQLIAAPICCEISDQSSFWYALRLSS